MPTLKDILGLPSDEARAVIEQIEHGLPDEAVVRFSHHSGLSEMHVAKFAHIPWSTMSRRKKAGRFSRDESDKVARLANLYRQALGLFRGQPAKAMAWLRAGNTGLGGKSPLDFAATEMGAREVEKLIGRLEHGVFA